MAPLLVPPSPIGSAQKSLSQERDRRFESGSLQRRVICELGSRLSGVPRTISAPGRARRAHARLSVQQEFRIELSALWMPIASRGKIVRAEPVAALYDQGRVHHIGIFPQLEDR